MALALRAAKAWGVIPSTYFALGERDRALMEGETTLSESITDTGYPEWLTRDPNYMGQFTASSFQDFAREALEVAQKFDKRNEPGMAWRVSLKQPELGAATGDGERHTEQDRGDE